MEIQVQSRRTEEVVYYIYHVYKLWDIVDDEHDSLYGNGYIGFDDEKEESYYIDGDDKILFSEMNIHQICDMLNSVDGRFKMIVVAE